MKHVIAASFYDKDPCCFLFFDDRGLAAGIYTTNSPEACQYVAESCEANVLVVENQKQLDKILQVRRFDSSGSKEKAS